MTKDQHRIAPLSRPRVASALDSRPALVSLVAVFALLAVAERPAHAGAGASAPPPSAAQEVPSGADVQPSSAPTPTPNPTAAPSVTGGNAQPALPAPRIDAQLSLRGTAVWDGLEGELVRLKLTNGKDLAGTMVAQDSANIAIARSSDGMVVAVPKAQVEAVNLERRPSPANAGPASIRPLDNGRSTYSAGVALLALGCPASFAGLVMLGVCPGCLYINLPLLLPGIGMVIGGAVALKRGKKKDLRFRKAWGIPLAGRMQLTPNVGFARGGGEVGFTLRF